MSDELVAVSLNHEQAIQYLRREEVQIINGKQLGDQNERAINTNLVIKPGWALVQYEGVNIGRIKILQHRINNYYPKEWRILKR